MLETRDYRHFRVVPRTPVIGGWIEGCNLADLDDAGLADLREADVLHQCAALDRFRRALDLEVLDDRDGIAIGQHIADGVLDHTLCLDLFDRLAGRLPLVRALRADEQGAHLVGVFAVAVWARRQGFTHAYRVVLTRV